MNLGNPYDILKEGVIRSMLNEDIGDDFNFKPINEGLGFHQGRDRENKITPNSFTDVQDRTGRQKRMKTLNFGINYGNRIQTPVVSKKTDPSAPPDEAQITKPWRSPSHPRQLAAYLVDLLVISFIAVGTLASFAFMLTGSIDYEFLLKQSGQRETVIGSVLLFCLYYLAYFTFMESNRTIGKELLRIETLRFSREKPSVFQCFLRALITLFSTLALFFPILLSLQDRLSETKLRKV